jgi:hypothetical protein
LFSVRASSREFAQRTHSGEARPSVGPGVETPAAVRQNRQLVEAAARRRSATVRDACRSAPPQDAHGELRRMQSQRSNKDPRCARPPLSCHNLSTASPVYGVPRRPVVPRPPGGRARAAAAALCGRAASLIVVIRLTLRGNRFGHRRPVGRLWSPHQLANHRRAGARNLAPEVGEWRFDEIAQISCLTKQRMVDYDAIGVPRDPPPAIR